MDKRKTIITCIVVLVMAVGAAWAMGYFRGTDPALIELQQLREQMGDVNLPDADRQRLRDEFRTKMDGLSEAQRDAFRESGRGRWEQQAQRRMDEFFRLPPAEQKKRLDETIDRMVQRQKERAQNPNANNGGGQGRGNGGGGGGRTQAQRDQRAKERIAKTDPKSRAQRDVYRQMMGDRMKQRGITPPPGGGGPGGRF